MDQQANAHRFNQQRNQPNTATMQASVFVLWQSLVVASYRSFFAELAQETRARIALAAPAKFCELAQQDVPCAPFSPPFKADDVNHPYFILDTRRPHVQAVWFHGLAKALRIFFSARGAKDADTIFLCVAEPYSITALLAWITARVTLGTKFTFICYAAQNIFKTLPLPLRLLQKFLFKKCSSILVIGREQEDVLRRHGFSGQTIFFPLWFDSSRFFQVPPPSNCKPVIGYAGSLTTAKGILDFLSCCDQQKISWADSCSVRIAGAGPLTESVSLACARLQKSGIDITFLGALAVDEMVKFYSTIDILIVPSRTMPNWKEQFGRVIIEANACGIVVVGSDSGEIPTVIGEPDRLFKEGDTTDMAKVINVWLARLQEPEARMRMRQTEATKAFDTYSDRALAKKFAAALQRIRQSHSDLQTEQHE